MGRFLFKIFILVAMVGGIAAGFLLDSRTDANQSYWLIEPDQKLGWQLRPSLEYVSTLRTIKTNAKGFLPGAGEGERDYIAIFTSSNGMGYDAAVGTSFPELLAGMASSLGGTSNYSQYRYSIVQGLRLYNSEVERRGAPLAKYVVISFGYYDTFRFQKILLTPDSDLEMLKKAEQHTMREEKLLWSTPPGISLYRLWHGLRDWWACGPERVPRARVSPEDFRAVALEFAQKVRADGSVPVLMSFPMRFEDSDDEDYVANEFEFAVAEEPDSLGHCAQREALELIDEQREHRIRRETYLNNESLRDVAAATGSIYVPAHEHFAENKNNLFRGRRSLSAEGHKELVQLIFQKVSGEGGQR
jgi:hypothetical protein